MAAATCSDEEFISLFKTLGPHATAEHLGIAAVNVFGRRRRIEARDGIVIAAPDTAMAQIERSYAVRTPFTIKNGTVVVGSDAHYWPDYIPVAHRALLYLCKELQPKLTVLNGDVIDGAGISRHPPIGWSRKPTVKAELNVVNERTTEIEDATKKGDRIWTLGNHDMRFECRLAAQTPEFDGVQGFSLKDQFPRWNIMMSAWINDSCVVKHRFKGGIHAAHNNTLWAGKTIVTGHLHSLKVTPFSDYNGTRYGVDTGTLNDPYGPHAAYGEDNPLNHRSGLAVLTFHKGMLLWPEIARVLDDDSFEFRGQVFKV
jgi:hypothetical protein